jgi:hypothetical protein
MKLNTNMLVIFVPVVLLPFSAFASDENRINPFIKPSQRVEIQKDTCDISVIQELVNKKVAELMPAPEDKGPEEVIVQVTKNMTNKEIITASGAKKVAHINGTSVYFNEESGIFMYDKEIISKTKG